MHFNRQEMRCSPSFFFLYLFIIVIINKNTPHTRLSSVCRLTDADVADRGSPSAGRRRDALYALINWWHGKQINKFIWNCGGCNWPTLILPYFPYFNTAIKISLPLQMRKSHEKLHAPFRCTLQNASKTVIYKFTNYCQYYSSIRGHKLT